VKEVCLRLLKEQQETMTAIKQELEQEMKNCEGLGYSYITSHDDNGDDDDSNKDK